MKIEGKIKKSHADIDVILDSLESLSPDLREDEGIRYDYETHGYIFLNSILGQFNGKKVRITIEEI